MSLQLPATLLADIWRHGEQSYPEEGAGLILGRRQGEARSAEVIKPVDNQWEAPGRTRRYQIDPRDVLAAEDQADDLGLEIIGVFHSHPDHPAMPSATDLHFAVPWYSYLITSVHLGKALESRAWRLDQESESLVEEQLLVDDHGGNEGEA